MVGIIDYGMGNLLSVYNAIDYIGDKVAICTSPNDLEQVDRIIIPGVGAFKNCSDKLINSEMFDALNEHVINKAKPTLGICLGMQIMATKSYEYGEYKGFGWFNAEVIKMTPKKLKLPNIGWSEINQLYNHKLFDGINFKDDFYFVHSYFVSCKQSSDVLANYEFENEYITAAILKNNIFATQFHPEKSQETGLRLLANFLNWKP